VPGRVQPARGGDDGLPDGQLLHNRQAEAGDLFARLGKHSTGKRCLYIKKLADADLAVLERLVAISWEVMNKVWPE
jgi:hypothetical protein